MNLEGTPTPVSEPPFLVELADDLRRQRAKVEAERDALLKFKQWVHAYLDGKGIPTHPDGPHSKEGCRIGDRMDFVFAKIDKLTAACKAIMAHECDVAVGHPCGVCTRTAKDAIDATK